MDDIPCAQLTHLFHALYRTSKGETGGLNPFKDDPSKLKEYGFDNAGIAMIREIKERVLNNRM